MYSEKAVLGSIMKNNYLVNDCGLLPGHFESNEHKYIFKNMMELYKVQKSCDLVTLITKCDPTLLGGASYLGDMVRLASDNKFEVYCENIMDSWRDREKKAILSMALAEDWTLEKIGQSFEQIHTQKVDDYADINDLLVDVFEMPWTEKEVLKGSDTGLKEMNLLINGLQDGELIILAARPSMGGLSPLITAM